MQSLLSEEKSSLFLKVKACLVVVLIVVVLAVARIGYVKVQGNFYPITEGVAYRSAQLDPVSLAYYVKKYGIRSVVNLRGESLGDKWWKDEKGACERLGLSYYNIKLSARRHPSQEKIASLLTIFQEAPRPVLIHCKAGADRSGLAGAIWKTAVENAPYEEAEEQLSIFYGHFPVGSTRAMDDFFKTWYVSFKNSKVAMLGF